MDGQRFDALTKTFASSSRRLFLKRLVGVATGGLAALVGIEAAEASCREPGRTCREHANCCSGLCGEKDATGRQRCQCRTAADCPNPGTCRESICTNGVCTTAVTTGAVCDDGRLCTVGDTCQADGICRGTPKVCDPPLICQQPGVCNPTTGSCDYAFQPDTAECRAVSCSDGVETLAANCPGDGPNCPEPATRSCAPYVCNPAGTGCLTGCGGDGDCQAGYHCDDGQCLANEGLGLACDEDSDCASGFCVNGICCNERCDGECEQCTAATGGVCSPASDTSCGVGGGQLCCNGICCGDGEGCVGTTCQATCLEAGTACDPATSVCCNGGFCESNVCCNYPNGTCATAEDCCASYAAQICVNGRCCVDDGYQADVPEDCCSGIQLGDGSCEACISLGQDCEDASQCCSTGGEPTNCASNFCSFDQAICCHDPGGSCSSDCDCCSGNDCCNGVCCAADEQCGVDGCQAVCLAPDQACFPDGIETCCADLVCGDVESVFGTLIGLCCHVQGDACTVLVGGDDPCCGCNRCVPDGLFGNVCSACTCDFNNLFGGDPCASSGECCSGYCHTPTGNCCRTEGASCSEVGPFSFECCPYLGLTCSGVNGSCIPCRTEGQSCEGTGVAGTCCLGLSCEDGTCVQFACGGACQVDSTCCPGQLCDVDAGECYQVCTPEGDICSTFVGGFPPCCEGLVCTTTGPGTPPEQHCLRP